MTKIIGIDPGLQKTGWGLIKVKDNNISYLASGFIATSPRLSMPKRLLQLHINLKEVMELYNPDEASIEETFVSVNSSSTLKLGQARGALLVTLANYKIPIYEYAPNLVKKSVTGAGKADKTQVSAMVKYLLPASNVKQADEADALAIAICHANHRNIINLTNI